MNYNNSHNDRVYYVIRAGDGEVLGLQCYFPHHNRMVSFIRDYAYEERCFVVSDYDNYFSAMSIAKDWMAWSEDSLVSRGEFLRTLSTLVLNLTNKWYDKRGRLF